MTQLDIQGIVFDVDGVLFDTERLTHQTWKTVSREMGWPQVGEAYLEFVGQNRTDIFRKMVELFGVEFPKETFMKVCSAYSQARMEREGVPMKPGVREILAFLKERGIPTALATSTGRPRTERRMEMTGLGPYFSAIITGDQVEHSKPDPEIYLLACQALGDLLSAQPVPKGAAAEIKVEYAGRFCAVLIRRSRAGRDVKPPHRGPCARQNILSPSRYGRFRPGDLSRSILRPGLLGGKHPLPFM